MSWLYEALAVRSEINGEIRSTRFLGRWLTVMSRTNQTSESLNLLWREALRKIPREATVKKILVVGLGTGAMLPLLSKRFPKAHITGIEKDPALLELAKHFRASGRSPFPEVHVGSFAEVLPKLRGPYDLILSDESAGRTDEVVRLLSVRGHFLLSVPEQSQTLESFTQPLVECARWKSGSSLVGYFRPHRCGVLGDPWPTGYLPYMACEAYLKREFSGKKRFQAIESNGSWGVRTHLGPVSFDRYMGAAKPDLKANGPGWAAWLPLEQQPTPPGWFRMIRAFCWRRLTGYVDLTRLEQDRPNWSELTRRELKKWRAQTALAIQPIDVESYCRAYAKSDKSSSLIEIFSAAVRDKSIRHKGLIYFWGIVSLETREVLGGFCSLDIPETQTSLHVNGFVLKAAQHSGAGTALVENWLTISAQRGFLFGDFDGFYAPGDPNEWKGYSHFKSQFAPKYVAYPHPFWRLLPRKT